MGKETLFSTCCRVLVFLFQAGTSIGENGVLMEAPTCWWSE